MIEDEVRLALDSAPGRPTDRRSCGWRAACTTVPRLFRQRWDELIRLLDEGAEKGESVVVPSVRPGRGPASERREEVTVGPVSEVILAIGFCGNALKDLGAENLTLVFPRVDDCVSLLLNDGCVREDIKRNPRCYYLTRGWFNHESSMIDSFDEWDQRFGRERADKLRAAMYAGYEAIQLIDTQAYQVEECLDQSQAVADRLNLRARRGARLRATAGAAAQGGKGQRDRRGSSQREDRFQPSVRRKGQLKWRLEYSAPARK